MRTSLTEEEWALASGLPEEDLVSLAVELDILVPASIDRRDLLERCVSALVMRGRAQGLPLSKYDREDVAALPSEHLRALGQMLGVAEPITVDRVLKAGERVFRNYEKAGRARAIALALPLLLTAVARTAAGGA